MAQFLVVLGAIFLAGFLILSHFKFKRKAQKVVLLASSLLLFAFYFYFLLQPQAVLWLTPTNSYFSHSQLVLVNFLRWFTTLFVFICFLAPWFNIKSFRNLAGLAPVVFILNLCFFMLNLQSYDKTLTYTSLNGIMFAFYMAIFGGIGFYFLFVAINERKFSKKQLLISFGVLALMFVSVIPLNLFQNLTNTITARAINFNLTHRIILYIVFAMPFVITLIFRKQSQLVKRLVVVWIAFVGLNSYLTTYTYKFTPTNLPLHICNTAIFLILAAYLFKCKPIFYFTYFVNVIGAFFALALPEIDAPITNTNTLHFWLDHLIVFTAPILGVTLKIFPRPNFKSFRYAVYIFSAYLVIIALVNGLFQAKGFNVDYFYLYNDFISKRMEFLTKIKDGFIWSFPYADGQVLIFYLYDIIVWVAYIFMMFMIWLIYSYSYKINDHYAKLAEFKLADELELKELKRQLAGRDLTEPLNEEGVDMIEFKHFSKRYGNSKKFAVKDFSLKVNDGEVFGFLGHNGAGKSTAIKSLVGIQSLSEGQILVCGYDIAKQPLQAKRLMGYVSDNHAVYEHLTGREYINYVADLYEVSEKDRTQRMERYLKLFNLEGAIDREIKGYSHGMKQKVMVISSLIHNPRVWVLDEPLTGLDPTSAYQIKECMKQHAQNGNIVFFSSHVIEVVEKVCDRIAIIKGGELEGVYDIKKMQQEGQSLEKLYIEQVQNTSIDDFVVKKKEEKIKELTEEERMKIIRKAMK